MQDIFNDLTGVARSIFTSGDMGTIALVLIVGFIAALSISTLKNLLITSVLAVVGFGVCNRLVSMVSGPRPGTLGMWWQELMNDWNAFMAMNTQSLLGYFLFAKSIYR